MSEEKVLTALRALAEGDRELQAPADLEIRLRQAFRRTRRMRVWRIGVISTAAAAALLMVGVWRANTGPAAVQSTNHPSEIVTEFFPLMDVAPPFEGGAVVRVNLDARAMRTVGLPVDEDHLADRVQADVLVGQEGLPRAIRFVKTVQ